MDAPQWRPTSSLAASSRGAPRTAYPDLSSMSSGGRDSPDLTNSVESILPISSNGIGIEFAPWENSISDRLVDHITSAITPPDSPQGSLVEPHTLAKALQEVATAIRFHAKWFSEADLANLLQTGLEAASSSSASADVFAAVHLVDTVGTYSFIPAESLDQSVRFISQAYYNAKKARKTKTLAKQVRTALIHILESHLGGQTVEVLLEIVGCKDENFLASKIGHAQTAGALMIIFQKLWLKDDVRETVPTPDLLQLFERLWYPARHGDPSLVEQIMETLADLVKDDYAVAQLDTGCCWSTLMDVVGESVQRMPRSSYAKAVVEHLVHSMDHLEAHQLPTLAKIATMAGLPLPKPLSDAMLSEWPISLTPDSWDGGFEELLGRLAASTLYTSELSVLAKRSVAATVLAEDDGAISSLAGVFQTCVTRDETTLSGAGILVNGLIELLEQRQLQGFDADPTVLFDIICGAAGKCVEATSFLSRLRADVEGSLYVEPEPRAAHNDAESSRKSIIPVPHVSLQLWERSVLFIMEESDDWEAYDCLLTRLPGLLGNHALFEPRIPFIRRLTGLICEQMDSSEYNDPPTHTGFTKSYITMHLAQVLAALVTYHGHLSKQDRLGMASALVKTAGSRDHLVSIPCIHGLTICCYELPDLMSSYMDVVIDKMSKMVTQRYLAIHVLQFLAGLSRLPDLVRNFQTHDYKKIFGVCGSYFQSIRNSGALSDRLQTPASDRDSKSSVDISDALPQYVYALAHHVIIFWYLILKTSDRNVLLDYIASCLRYTTIEGHEIIEDQGLVTMDLIDRINAGDYVDDDYEPFDATDGRLVVRYVLVGVLLLASETSLRTGKSIITVRRASGTTLHLIESTRDRSTSAPALVRTTTDTTTDDYISVLPTDKDGRTYGHVSIPKADSVLGAPELIILPNDDDAIRRAIQSFDRTPALDSHKAGLIYVGEGQSDENEILRNHMGSPDYVRFVEGLGALTKLKDAKFNTQGLDRTDDMDGKHTVVWHNDVTELVFHVVTFMPNNEDVQLNTANKKRHIGNDFVNIVFNNSGARFDFNTFPSQFNCVYIVITPSARTTFLQTRLQIATTTIESEDTYYRVEVMTRPGYPSISSAAEEKVISGASLPSYVRNLALNECIFSLMWAARDDAGEYPSSWRSRLQQLRRLRERFGNKNA